MASDYTPTNVTQGFGAEVDINKNFNDIKLAMDKLLNRLVTGTNSMGVDLDMGGNQILNLPQAIVPTDPVLLSQLNSLARTEVVQTVTFADPMTLDASVTTYAKITMVANATVNFSATAPSDGQAIIVGVTQGGAGSFVITWDAKVRFSTELPTAVLSTAAGDLDYLVFRYNADDDKYDLLAVNRGF